MAADAAAAAALAEEPDEEPRLLPELTRLVEARIALAPREFDTPPAAPAVLESAPPALIPPLEAPPPEIPEALVVEARDCTCELPPPPPRENEPEGPPRPNPDRLPRSCGARIRENFSAPVVPVNRNVRSSTPARTAAVRVALTTAASCLACSACRIHKAATPTTTTTPRITHQKRERFGGASTGVFTGVGGATGWGAGVLICGTCIHTSLPP
jgi:hypothetical protein